MATNTGGGTTASFSNTPQAVDDLFTGIDEDSTSVWIWDVMADDLGGKAKTLWSLDNSVSTSVTGGTAPADLLTQDVGRAETTATDCSLGGAKIWITADGKVGYDAGTLSSAFRAQLQGLQSGQYLYDTFTYAIRLGNGTLSWATAQVKYQGVNDGPTISTGTDDKAAVTEDTTNPTLSDTGKIFFADLDNSDTHTVTTTADVGNTLGGTLTAIVSDDSTGDGAGAVTWTYNVTNAATQHLGKDQTATETFTVKIDDSHGGTVTQTVVATVTGVNDAPDATDATNTATEGAATINGHVTATDVDDGAVLSYALVGSAPAGLTFSSDGSYSVDPTNAAYNHLAQGAKQDVTVTYKVTDEWGASDTATLKITVTGTNDTPDATDGTNTATEGGSVLNSHVTATDADDGAVLTYALTAAAPAGLTFNTDGSYSFDPSDPAYNHLSQGAKQDVTVTYKVTDEWGASDTASLKITVTGTNDTPDATDGTNAATEDGATVNGSLTATDADDGTVLTYALVDPTPAGLTFNPDGTYSFDPTDPAYNHLAQGAHQDVVVTYKVSDEWGASDTASLKITVTGTNDAPDATDATDTATEGGSVVNGHVTATDADDGAVLTYALVDPTPDGLTFNTDGTYSFDPTDPAYNHLAKDATQDVTVTYKVTDEWGASDTASLKITVTGTNDAPDATDATDAATEGGSVVNGSVSATDADDGAVLGYALVGSTSAGLTFNPDGTYSFDPTDPAYNHLAKDATQDVTVTYKVTDEWGASDTASLKITVTGTNDAPDATDATDAATEGGSVVNGSVSATDADDGAVLGYALVGSAPAGLTFNPDGTYSFDPTDPTYNHLAMGATQDVTVGYQVTDEWGASDTASLKITVTGTNDDPDATDATDTATEGGSVVNGHVTATDADDGAVLTYALVDPTPDGLTFNTDGTYSFDPTDPAYDHLAKGVTQDVTVSYQVTDEWGASDTASLKITVTGTNDTPDATDGTNAATEGGAVVNGSVTATDADDGAVLTYALVDPTPDGLTFNADGSYKFDPTDPAYNHLAKGVTQDVTVSYQVTDEWGASDTASLKITVTGTNDDPNATDATDTATEGGSVVNGHVTAADADDGAVLTYALVDPTPDGLTFNTDGTYSFDPTDPAYDHLAKGVTQDVTVSYQVTDGWGASDTASLKITVTGTNDTPDATDATDAATEGGSTVNGSVSATDADDGAVLGYALVGSAPSGLTFNPDGSYSFDPTDPAYNHLAKDATQDVTVTYKVTDEWGASDTANLKITVTGTNDAPDATDATDAATEGGSVVNGSVSATDADDGAVLGYALVGSAPAGLTFNPDGTYSFDPTDPAYNHLAKDATQDVTVTYKVTDEWGASDTANLKITVTGTNDAPDATDGTNTATEGGSVVNGSVSATDADDGAVLGYALVGSAPAGLTFNPDGTYSFDPTDPAYNHLAKDATQDVTVTYKVTDEWGASDTASLKITVTGTNDTPDATDATNTATEGGSVVNGSVSATDADDGAVLGYALTAAAPAGLTFNPNGTYSFDPTNAAYNHLAKDATQDVVVTYKVTDEWGASDTATLKITVTGTNDAATITGGDTGSVTEDGVLVASGALTAADPDDGQSGFTASTGAGAYGSLAFHADGTWTYTLDNTKAQPLASSDAIPEVFTVHSLDGTAHSITVTVHGADEAPVTPPAPPVYNGNDDPNDFDAGGVGTVLTTGVDNYSDGTGSSIIFALAGNDVIHGNNGSDTIYGGEGNDQLFGDNGTDNLYGGSGADTLQGDASQDLIVGGYGADNLTGGGGPDTFKYLDIKDTGDTITDFDAGSDQIDLSAIDADTSAAGNQAFVYGGQNASLVAHGVTWYESGGNTILQIDTDGNLTTTEMVITLTGTGLGLGVLPTDPHGWLIA